MTTYITNAKIVSVTQVYNDYYFAPPLFQDKINNHRSRCTATLIGGQSWEGYIIDKSWFDIDNKRIMLTLDTDYGMVHIEGEFLAS